MSSPPPKHPADDPEFQSRRSLFLEDWTTTVLPHSAEAQAYLQHAVTYASGGLQASYILNGGALAALPTLATVLTNAEITSIAFAAIPFVVGIVATAISSFATYMNYNFLCLIKRHDADAQGARLGDFYNRSATTVDSAQRDIYSTWVTRTLWIGIGAAMIALVAFIAGSAMFFQLATASTSAPRSVPSIAANETSTHPARQTETPAISKSQIPPRPPNN